VQKNKRVIGTGILEIVGTIMQVLGLAEQVQRIVPTDRRQARKRHSQMDGLLSKFINAIDDTRMAFRSVSSAIGESVSETPRDSLSFAIAPEEFSILTRGVHQLHDAIRTMTNITFELEIISSGMPDEIRRYYHISQAGQPLLEDLRDVLGGNSNSLGSVIDAAERYLDICACKIDERNQ
jgi:hypothetical protein